MLNQVMFNSSRNRLIWIFVMPFSTMLSLFIVFFISSRGSIVGLSIARSCLTTSLVIVIVVLSCLGFRPTIVPNESNFIPVMLLVMAHKVFT